MGITIIKKPSRGKGEKKVFYTLSWGRGAGEREATGIYTFVKPKDQTQRNHNLQALAVLERKQSQMVLDQQSVSVGSVPPHRFKANFLEYYAEFVENNKQGGNRHLEGSFSHFKAFLKRNFLSSHEVTENLCERFRKYLLDHFNGDTPANYFSRFKRVIKAATKEGYFRVNPVEDVAAKANKNHRRKENLEVEEYLALLKTPCLNNEVREAFIICCYTGLRWCDIKPLKWTHFRKDELVFLINQEKTLVEHRVILHSIAKAILEKRLARANREQLKGLVFKLPSQDMALRTLDNWCGDAGIQKHITWHSARLSFSILLQDARVDDATVALLLGHASTQYVNKTYKRFRPKNAIGAIANLPSPVPSPAVT
jgi:integrase